LWNTLVSHLDIGYGIAAGLSSLLWSRLLARHASAYSRRKTVKKKIRKIVLGRNWFVSWTAKRRLELGQRYGRYGKRHLTVEENGKGVGLHLTDERYPPGHPKRNRDFVKIPFAKLKKLEREFAFAGVKAFINGLVPVTAEELEKLGFKLMVAESFGMKGVRLLVKSIRPTLKLRAPSEAQMEDAANHAMGRLRPMSDLENFTKRSPGTVSAILIYNDQPISWSLFHYPEGVRHPDGSELPPGWYALVDRDGINTAHAQALLSNVGPDFFPWIFRALRWLGLDDEFDTSPAELEDCFRRIAAGESVDALRAARLINRDTVP
jgi:hypothetical protein